MRTLTELAEDIGKFDLADKKDRTKLLHQVMHHWTVFEVFAYHDTCLPGGSHFDYQLMTSSAFANAKTQSLIVIFSATIIFCLLNAGALTVLRDDVLDLFHGKTPDQLGKLVPPEKRKLLERLDIVAQLDRIKGEVGNLPKGLKAAAKEGAKVGVSRGLIPAVKRASREGALLALDGPDATKPKTRSSGGGRKKERDLDDAQVKAVLALTKRKNLESFRAYSVEIIRDMMNGKGEYQNPYDKPKDLDAAVRRYCKRIRKPLVFKPRKGKWSAKS